MFHRIHRITNWARALWAPTGLHRRYVAPQPPPCVRPAPAPRVRRPMKHSAPLRGEASALVRPYVLTHDELIRWRTRRRRTLWISAGLVMSEVC